MGTKTTIQMAREAAGDDWGLFQEYMPEIHRIVELVRADESEQGQKWFDAVTAQHKQLILAEREACAKAAEDFLTKGRSPLGKSVAAAIRARSNT